jgi:hypothetical protein
MSLSSTYAAGSKLVGAKANLAIPFGVRYEQRVAQTIATATDTLAKFDTAVETNTDVTVSGTGNTVFLLNRIGKWRVETAMRWAGNAGGNERHIFVQTGWNGSTFDASQRKTSQTNTNVGTVGVTVACSTSFRIAAATSLIIGLFQNAGGNVNTDVGFGGTNHIALTWEGP